jgi:hypothetical protein
VRWEGEEEEEEEEEEDKTGRRSSQLESIRVPACRITLDEGHTDHSLAKVHGVYAAIL